MDSAAVAAIAPFARNVDSEVRQAALAALTGIGGDPAAAVILPLLNDPSAAVRRGAVTVVGELQARSAPAEDAISSVNGALPD